MEKIENLNWIQIPEDKVEESRQRVKKIMKHMNPKKEAMMAHKIAALFTILVDDLHEFVPGTEVAIKMKEKASEVLPLAEELLSHLYEIDKVNKSVYLNDLANKIDTVIRKNFQEIQ